MNDVVFTSFFLIEIYFTIVLVVNCAVDELLPIKSRIQHGAYGRFCYH